MNYVFDKITIKLRLIQIMTEYTKNSRNRAESGSRNVERSKEGGPTHPYSHNPSDSRSQYSVQKSAQEESLENVDYNFEIALQYIMPLVSTIKQQNEHMKQQKRQMEQDMSQLHKLSHQLLEQNQQMRKHYSARTGDIKKIIQTISINTNEETNDVNHQSFLLKESNCILVKKIEEQMKSMQTIQANLAQKQKQLHQQTQTNIKIEQNNCDLLVKNRQLFQKCQRMRTETQKVSTVSLDESINDLLSTVVTLRNTNKTNIIQAKQILNEYQQERPAIEQNHNNVVRSNRHLEQQANQLKQVLRNASRVLLQRQQNHKKQLNELISALRQKQKTVNKVSQVDKGYIDTKMLFQKSRTNIKRKQQQIQQISNQKQKLVQLIANKKKANRQIEQQYRQNMEKQQSNHKQLLKRLRDELAQQEVRANQQICSKISPQCNELKSKIEDQKQEYAVLVQQVQDLKNGVSRLDNPIKQIIRLQYKLKKTRK